jgi:murein DD-endopeptidase MepM/ murein hydrolase activator NlpD
MKKILTVLLSMFVAGFAFGQTEDAAYKIAAENFEKNYNAGNYELLFSSFSPEMKKALPLDKTKAFFTKLQIESGKIIQRDFLRYERGYASYKTGFDKSVSVLNIALDENSKISGFFVKPFREKHLPEMERNLTKLILPFKGEWFVVWGGDTKELNYHIENEAQKNAFDFIITDSNNKSYKTDGETNEDYYAFGKELVAPCDGAIVLAVDGVPDNKPGKLNPVYVPGNTVIIKTKNNEYLFFAHFKQHSIRVKQGQKVKQGTVLGLCGNSGNSTEAHLHFHIQNDENMMEATGIKCYFEKLVVNGEVKTDYSPVQKEKIQR